MKALRVPPHTRKNLRDREISIDNVGKTVENAEKIVPGDDFRTIYMRRYYDSVLNEEMLLRVIVEETETEMVVVTAYKTSKISKYLRGV